jgi:CheY-like chemotaxis protein
MMIRNTLEKAGYKLFIATSAEAMRDLIYHESLDLIILDIMMPEMDGFEVCSELKKNPFTQSIPIIFLSILSETINTVKGLKLGAVDYLIKPVAPEELLVRVQTHVSIHRKSNNLAMHNTNLKQEIEERKQAEGTLRDANIRLNLMNSITRHELINKLSAMWGYVELEKLDNSDPEFISILTNMESIIRVLESHINFTRLFQEMGSTEPEWLYIGGIFPELEIPPFIRFSADLQDIQIYADPLIRKVFSNLLDNTLRYGHKTTRVQVSCTETPDGLTIFWEDDGVGIPEHEKNLIFERGYGKNTGFGLFLIREILSITGISIHESGQEGIGARFEILVPPGLYRFR